MKLAFYKGTKKENPKSDLVDNVICFWTKSRFSHVEIIFSNGISFSSSPRDKGCRYKPIVYDDSLWVYLIPKFNKNQEQTIMEFCNRQNGKPYDWVGIFLCQFIHLNIDDPKKWFCSELVAKICNLPIPYQYDVGKLFNKLKELNYAEESYYS